MQRSVVSFSLVPQRAELPQLIAKAEAFIKSSKAPSTRAAMKSDWSDVEIWCREHGFPSLTSVPSSEVIALYLADRAESLSPPTLTRRLTSITQALQAAGLDGPSPASTKQPLVGAVLRGIRRSKGVAPGRNRKDPLLTEQIRQLLANCGNDLRGIRDRSMLLFGFAAGGLRRAELVCVEVENIEFTESGVIYHQGRSKTDQEGVGRQLQIQLGSDLEKRCMRWRRCWCGRATRRRPVR